MTTVAAAYIQFIRANAAEFEAIAWATRGASPVEDLHSEAWIIAAHIEAKRGTPVNFNDPADQQLVLR